MKRHLLVWLLAFLVFVLGVIRFGELLAIVFKH